MGGRLSEDNQLVVEEAVAAAPHKVASWPFLAYLAIWAVFAGLTAWQLVQLPAATPTVEAPVYPYTVLAGMVLTSAGPALVLMVWLGSLNGSSGKGARFVDALLKGSVATVVGVMLWWASLVALDVLRLGRPF